MDPEDLPMEGLIPSNPCVAVLQGHGKEHHTLLHLLLIFLDQLCNKSLPLLPAHACLEETSLIFGAILSMCCWKEGTLC